eukprot:scaffold7741_cov305-Pinguiococcus_pyrenoidosus.AAC.2
MVLTVLRDDSMRHAAAVLDAVQRDADEEGRHDVETDGDRHDVEGDEVEIRHLARDAHKARCDNVPVVHHKQIEERHQRVRVGVEVAHVVERGIAFVSASSRDSPAPDKHSQKRKDVDEDEQHLAL